MIRHIPYGETDYVTIRKENSYYVDKTAFISYFENAAKYIMFLRPRRFGKSLFINTLAAYYDVLQKDNYEQNFGGLNIYNKTTPMRGKYMVLKLSFASVDSRKENVEASFNSKICIAITSFIDKYRQFLPEETPQLIAKVDGKSNEMLYTLIDLAKKSAYKIYVMIDEYDNFANTLFSTDELAYKQLTHGDGFFRLFFNVLKDMTSDNEASLGRIFITGVSPLTLSDVTSGFNIADNLSIDPNLNDVMGFSETDVKTMLEYYRDTTGVFKHSVEELIEIMKPIYNDYCFAPETVDDERVFNSDMVLYFIKKYTSSNGRIPDKLVDPNVRTDFFKMEKMVKIENSFGEKSRIILNIVNTGKAYFELNPEFAIAELSLANNLQSLLYYMGLLSFGVDERGIPAFVVPNDTVRQQYCMYLEKCYTQSLGWRTDITILGNHWNTLVFDGDCKPYISYIASVIDENSAVRDFNDQGESFVKGFFLSHFCKNSSFITYTELEANHGFTDLYLEPLGYKRHAYIIELKYCKKNSTDAEVNSKKDEAKAQIQKYLTDHRIAEKCTAHNWELHTAAIVFRGWKMEVLE
ncbi:MAG: AAA family ATPase [Bacteroidales bacterium]|nr:AAA family ATPase [Bacteroidales bacterium]